MTTKERRASLAVRFANLAEVAASWDMYWSAARNLAVGELLVEWARELAAKDLDELEEFVADLEKGYSNLVIYSLVQGMDAARKLAADIDREQAEKHKKAQAKKAAAAPPQLGPKGFTALRECAEIAAEFGCFPGLGGDA